MTEVRYLTVEEVAAELRMAPRWVRMQCKAGNLRATKLGTTWRIEASAVAEFMAGEVKPARSSRLSARQARRAS